MTAEPVTAEPVPIEPRPARITRANALGTELTGRELQCLALAAQGLTNAGIGERLWLAENTTKTFLRHVMARLGARDRTHAVVLGLAHGLLALDASGLCRVTGYGTDRPMAAGEPRHHSTCTIWAELRPTCACRPDPTVPRGRTLLATDAQVALGRTREATPRHYAVVPVTQYQPDPTPEESTR